MTSTELVWDNACTATACSGASRLAEGPAADWDPRLLLATAASASLLNTFIDIARDAGLPVLGYTSQQSTEADGGGPRISGIVIKACIIVPTPAAAAAAETAWTLATGNAPVIRALACSVRCERSIVVLDDLTEAHGCH